MGEVYRATDTVLSRTVAVKLLAERHAQDPDIRARFEREGRAAARLSGTPHVVTVFDVGEWRGRPFIVMEHVDGGSLHDRLRTGAVPSEQTLAWLAEAGEALDAAHARGVVHRDVKPANLLLDRDGELYVSDFGIALAAGQDTLTLPGTVLGTVGYIAPEQARGEPATPASDRYSLGVVAFELLSGRRPFAAETPQTELFAHVNADVPTVRATAPELPSEVDAALAHALAKEPADRPRTCGELVRELRRALSPGVPVTLIDHTAPTAKLSKRPRRRRLSGMNLAALGLVALAGISAAALLGTGRGDSPTRTVTRTNVRTVVSTTTTTGGVTAGTVDGATLDRQGYARMQAGDYTAALPLLERSVTALQGTGTLDEAYADYNLAFTRFALGSCDGVLALLDRSESIQGHRTEIDRLRREAQRACTTATAPLPAHGKGHGKGKGQGEGDEG
jgi:hypothetical protein